VEHVRAELSLSERRVCRILGQHRSTQRKIPTSPDYEAALTTDIIALALKPVSKGNSLLEEMEEGDCYAAPIALKDSPECAVLPVW
jgi:hypothetical protein